METRVKFSIGGAEKVALRQAISSSLVIHGFTKLGTCEYARLGNISPEQVRAIIDLAYDEDAKHPNAKVITLDISSDITHVIIRRHRSRAI